VRKLPRLESASTFTTVNTLEPLNSSLQVDPSPALTFPPHQSKLVMASNTKRPRHCRSHPTSPSDLITGQVKWASRTVRRSKKARARAVKSQNEVDGQMKLKFTAQQTKIFIFISDSCLAVMRKATRRSRPKKKKIIHSESVGVDLTAPFTSNSNEKFFFPPFRLPFLPNSMKLLRPARGGRRQSKKRFSLLPITVGPDSTSLTPHHTLRPCAIAPSSCRLTFF
jgi:hypothetical protein